MIAVLFCLEIYKKIPEVAYKTGYLIKTEIYCSWFWRLNRLRSRCQCGCFLARVLSLVHSWFFSLCPQMVEIV